MKKDLLSLARCLLKGKYSVVFSVVMFCCMAVAHLQAQVPQAFKYQAVARNNAGAVLPNQNVSFRMSVIQGTLPGTVVYTETHAVTTNEFGLATLGIGWGTPVSGTFSTIDWGVTPTYLKTELDPAGGSSYTNMGTTELLSVPYAMQAGSAPDEDWIISGINLYPAVNGYVGLGVANPTQKLHVNGNMRLTGALYDFNNQPGTSGQVLSTTGTKVDWIDPPSGISGSGLENKLAYWTGTGSLAYNFSLHWDNTNARLGLGTTSPSTSFHLFNGAGSGGGTYSTSLDAVIEDDDYAYLELNGGSFAGITFNDDNASIRAGMLYNYIFDNLMFRTGGTDNRMVISEAGNVGIGETAPSQKLHVGGNLRLTGALHDANNQAGTNGQVLSSTASGTDWISLPSGLTGMGSGNKVTLWKSNSTLGYANSFHYDTVNNRLGLGTASPYARLHVYNGPGGGGGIYNDIYDLIIEDDAHAYIQFNGSGYGGILFNDDNDASYAGIVYNSTSDILNFQTGDADYRIAITETGNVGIGLSNPSQKFHVSGSMRLTGALYDENNQAGSSGQILSTTGTGTDWITNPSPAGSGAASKIAFWTNTGTLGYNNNLHWNNTAGFLAIGHAYPSCNLDVRESAAEMSIFGQNATNGDGNVAIYGYNVSQNNLTNHVAGVYGKADGANQPNSYGVVGHNYYDGIGIGAWSFNGDLIRAYAGDWPGGALSFYVDNGGSVYCYGTYNTFKGVASKGPNEYVAMAATQSPEALMEDCGSAELVNGSAVVKIDETFAEIANTGNNYQVFLTPVSEEPVILSVGQKSATSFTVKGYKLDGTSATCPFDYRLVARDNDSKGGRFEKVDIPEPIVVPREE